MRVIKNINKRVKCVGGFDEKDAPTIKLIFIRTLLGDRIQGEDIIKSKRIAEYIYDSKDSVELEDAPLNYLREVLTKNPLGYPTFAIGEAIEHLDKSGEIINAKLI